MATRNTAGSTICNCKMGQADFCFTLNLVHEDTYGFTVMEVLLWKEYYCTFNRAQALSHGPELCVSSIIMIVM